METPEEKITRNAKSPKLYFCSGKDAPFRSVLFTLTTLFILLRLHGTPPRWPAE